MKYEYFEGILTMVDEETGEVELDELKVAGKLDPESLSALLPFSLKDAVGEKVGVVKAGDSLTIRWPSEAEAEE